jgi:hypothetical protein
MRCTHKRDLIFHAEIDDVRERGIRVVFLKPSRRIQSIFFGLYEAVDRTAKF